MAVSGTEFGSAASDYGTYRAGFPESFYTRLITHGFGLPGQSVIDLGTGTGTLARGFAQRGCEVTGVDPDDRMLAQAKALDEAADVSINYLHSPAESIALPDACADLVIAGQCWHWFDSDCAMHEVKRLLVPGGHLVITHFDWLPLSDNVVAATESLIKAYNPAWHLGDGDGLYPHYMAMLGEAGMTGLEMFAYDTDVPYSHEAWRGRIRSSAGIAALNDAATAQFDNEMAELLAARYPANPLAVPHRVFAAIAQTPL